MSNLPSHTGERLARQCLDQASGDYGIAAEVLLSMPTTPCRDIAIEVLAFWAAFAPIANDNEAPVL